MNFHTYVFLVDHCYVELVFECFLGHLACLRLLCVYPCIVEYFTYLVPEYNLEHDKILGELRALYTQVALAVVLLGGSRCGHFELGHRQRDNFLEDILGFHHGRLKGLVLLVSSFFIVVLVVLRRALER